MITQSDITDHPTRIWVHEKSGVHYEWILMTIDKNILHDQEVQVVYKKVGGDIFYNRRISEFIEKFKPYYEADYQRDRARSN